MDTNWRLRGNCADLDPDIMFPDNSAGSMARAKKVCRGCDVKLECLLFALANDVPDGIWAGLTPGQRNQLKVGALVP